MEENQVEVKQDAYAVPWSIADTWIGVVLLIVLSIGLGALALLKADQRYFQTIGVLLLEAMYVLPVVVIFAVRRISWRTIGFGSFSINVVGIGCGLLIGGYIVILIHNGLLYWLGVDTQGDQIFDIFNQLESPGWLMITGSIVAPLVEEIFFRGFLFQGFRQKYGWQAALFLSSAIFGAAHLDPVSFVPTFVLGCVLAYMYHRSNSVWPGILFHAAINSFGLCAVYLISKYPGLLPVQ